MEKRAWLNGCELGGTKYCRLLNMHACEECTVRGERSFESVKRDLDLYETLLPEGGVTRLFTEEGCQFCRGEANPRHGYAILDMAHPEPKRTQKHLIGRRAASIGTMIPLQFGICDRCRRRFLLIEYLPTVLPLAAGIIGLFIVYLTALADRALGVGIPWPFILWLAAVVLAMVAGRVLSTSLNKKYAKDMRTDVMEHPTVRAMTARGWVPIVRNTQTRLVFTKKRIGRGLGTAAEEPKESD